MRFHDAHTSAISPQNCVGSSTSAHRQRCIAGDDDVSASSRAGWPSRILAPTDRHQNLRRRATLIERDPVNRCASAQRINAAAVSPMKRALVMRMERNRMDSRAVRHVCATSAILIDRLLRTTEDPVHRVAACWFTCGRRGGLSQEHCTKQRECQHGATENDPKRRACARRCGVGARQKRATA